jgi:hypothetical protein
MKIFFSGFDPGGLQKPAFESIQLALGLGCWCATHDLVRTVDELLLAGDDFKVVWLYTKPICVLSSVPNADQDLTVEERLQAWASVNQAGLNLRSRLGARMVFARVEGGDAGLVGTGNLQANLSFQAAKAESALPSVLNNALELYMPSCMTVYQVLLAATALQDEPPRELQSPLSALAAAAEEAHALRSEAENAEKLNGELKRVQAQLSAMNEDHARQRMQVERENELLQLQMHAVQEELEQRQRGLVVATSQLLDAQEANRTLREQLVGVEQRGRESSLVLTTELPLLEVQLHQVREELESYYYRNKSLEQELVSRPQLVDYEAMRSQLVATEAELKRQIASHCDLLRVPTRGLLKIVAARLDRRFLGERLSRMYKRRRLQAELRVLRASKWFDGAWYLQTYPDVRDEGIDALLHYHQFGWKEGRNPGPEFDSAYYLNTNVDVRDSGFDPLLHYLLHGEREGRRPTLT